MGKLLIFYLLLFSQQAEAVCQLLGKIAARDGIAVFECSNYGKVYRKKGGLVSGWKVLEIDRFVKVQKDEATYYLRVGNIFDVDDVERVVSTGFERKDNTIRISKQLRDHLKGPGMYNLVMSAIADPVTDADGQMYGFFILSITPGSFLDQIGIKDGDTVTEIDGVRITSALSAMRLLQELKDKDDFTITVSSGGVTSLLKVIVP